jgi:DNA replication licensing factor MCM2
LVTVKLSELEGRVSFVLEGLYVCSSQFQAKEHDIFDITPFLRSKLFSTNGYKVNEGVIEKRFQKARVQD